MNSEFLIHNAQLEDPKRFKELDPHLRRLKYQHYVFTSPLIDQLPVTTPGIYTIGGARQIGKTTLLKQWMAKLLREKVPPQAMAFFSGELIVDYHSLLHIIQYQLKSMPQNTLHYLIIDEITYIADWDKAIKYAADAGLLENTVLILTGSDLVLMKEARMRFPGRRGKAATIDYHVYPLSFREWVTLKNNSPEQPSLNNLYKEFDSYLVHGGYLTAINDLAIHKRILEATLITYSDWIRGDMLKRGKQESYLKEILSAIIKRYGTQITWNTLAKDLSIDHPKTVSDYIEQLESMDAVFVQAALMEDKLTAAPKKARKVIFTDPFIFHAVRTWLEPTGDPYVEQIKPMLSDSKLCSKLVEACVTAHYRRFYPTYYIKADNEVDIAYVKNKRFWPVEIKWTEQLHAKEFKQIIKYSNSQILAKTKESGSLLGVPTEPLPLALWELGGA